MNSIFETKVAIVELINDKILKISFKEKIHLTLENAHELVVLRKEYFGDKPLYILIDLSNIQYVGKSVYRYAEINQLTIALAIIVNSPLTKIIGNLAVYFYEMPYPIKMFKDKEKAANWLKSHSSYNS